MNGTVHSVEFIRHIDEVERVDECKVVIDLDEIYAYYNYNELMDFLNKEVTYVSRVDMVNGMKALVLCNISEVGYVHTVEKVEGVKLYVENNERPFCNFSLNELRFGDFYPNSVAFVTGVDEGASQADVHWFDLTCLDKNSKVFRLRIFAKAIEQGFDNIEYYQSAIGKYIKFDLQLTRYGYQCKTPEILAYTGGEVSPEVAVAKKMLEAYLEEDKDLKDYVVSKNLLQYLYDKIDGEPGYCLVRMAAELMMADTLGNLSADVDVRSLKRAVYCTRISDIPRKSNWSPMVYNMNSILRSATLKSDEELTRILDCFINEPPTPTKIAYLKIRDFVNTLMKIRRGEDYEKDFIDARTVAQSMFGGLL